MDGELRRNVFVFKFNERLQSKSKNDADKTFRCFDLKQKNDKNDFFPITNNISASVSISAQWPASSRKDPLRPRYTLYRVSQKKLPF